jgi:hypothetical protein
LRETKDELDHVKGQVKSLSLQMAAANDAAMEAMMQRQEMLRYAAMPGVTIEDWRKRFEVPPTISA